ncbi:MAG: hypothetical protein AAF992_27685 [Bacteroidota bacterium]
MNTIMDISVVAIDEPKLQVRVDALNSVLSYQWKEPILDDEVTTGFLAILNLIERHSIANVIADLSAFEEGTVTTDRWINDNYCETLKEVGIRKMAVIVPENAFNEFSNRMVLSEKVVSLLNAKKFTSKEDAHIWFQQ